MGRLACDSAAANSCFGSGSSPAHQLGEREATQPEASYLQERAATVWAGVSKGDHLDAVSEGALPAGGKE